jgi:hypothetical protein
LSIKLSGKLTKEDFGRFAPRLDRLIDEHGRLGILCEMHDVNGWDTGKEDIKFDVRHLDAIARLAFNCDKSSERAMASLKRPIAATAIRYFDENKVNEARE